MKRFLFLLPFLFVWTVAASTSSDRHTRGQFFDVSPSSSQAITGTISSSGSNLNINSTNGIKLAPTSLAIDVSSSKIVNVVDPVSTQDAATKNYVDSRTFVPISPTRQAFKPEGTTATGNLTTASSCISSVASLNGINVGAGITDSTTPANLLNGTYIIAIPGSCPSGQIQMSSNAVTAATTDTFVFGASKSTTATATSTSNCLSAVGSTAGVAVGAFIYDVTNLTGKIAVNAVVAGVPGTCPVGQIQMSLAAIGSATGDTIIFSGGQYNRPTPTPLYIKITGAAAGGGAGGGTTGGDTYFGSTTLLAAKGGGPGSGNGGVGGTVTSTLTNNPRLIAGGPGGGSFPLFASGAPSGGAGGTNPFGGGGGAGTNSNVGQAGVPNTGSGGGGNGSGVGGTGTPGGGAGAYFDAIIPSPAASYPFTIGLGGTGVNGTSGSTGVIYIDEYYQ